MNLEQLERKNEKFQKAAAQLTNLMPDENLVPLTSMMIRSSRKLKEIFPMLFTAKTEIRFSRVMERIEEEIDEIIFALDRLAERNKGRNQGSINEFIKYGYDMLSIYSFACDKIIEKRVAEEF